VAVARRRGAEHHDRSRRLAHDVAKRGEAVELRHVDVERHDLGVERPHLAERLTAVAGRPDDAELPRALDELRDDLAHERAVVDDEDGGALR
jgi:hypothetical protein